MKAQKPRLAYFDGLRALAALWVVLGHIWAFRIPVLVGWKGWACNWLWYNHLAVDVFIVISGYCLTLPVMESMTLKRGPIDFVQRRIGRIVPAYLAAILLGLAFMGVATLIGPRLDGNIFQAKTVIANMIMLQDALPAMSEINRPLWSVAFEFKIYLLFPLLLWIQRRWGWSATFAFAIVVGYGIAFAASVALRSHAMKYFCSWYLVLFVMGSFACWLANRPARWTIKSLTAAVFIVATIGTIFLFHKYPNLPKHSESYIAHYPVIDTAVGMMVAAGLLLLAWASPTTPLRRLLEWQPLVVIGVASYSLYLTHEPCLFVARAIVYHVPLIWSHSFVAVAAIAIIGLPLSAAMTYAFFQLFERPHLIGLQPPTPTPTPTPIPAGLSLA